ncbi:MAG: DegV family protein [Bacillota bacterium]|jgi:DegV family protein with EDD domain
MSELFRVATDSGCDLPLTLCEERGVLPLQLVYEMDGVQRVDTMDHGDCHRFYEEMRAGKEPHTSQVTPQQFYDFWEARRAESDLPLVHIAMGSGISGTYGNGVIAREQFLADHPGTEIYLVDSTLASVGYGMLALDAARLRDEGKTAAECVAWLEARKAAVNTYYTTGDLTYLYRSGRVSRTGMTIAHALNIWPILNLDLEGHLIVQEKARGKKKTIARIHRIIGDLVTDPSSQTLFICHSDIADEAKAFGDEIREKFGFKDVYYTYIGSTIGAHAGPGLMAAFFYGKPRTM